MKKPQLPTLAENLEKLSANRQKASKLFADVLDKTVKKVKTDDETDDLDAITEADPVPARVNVGNALRITVLGGGSFGTAMANLAAKNGAQVTLWVRDKRSVRAMQKTRINKKYLPDFVLDDDTGI